MNPLQLESLVKFIAGMALLVLSLAGEAPTKDIGIILMIVGFVEFPFRFLAGRAVV